MARPLTHSPPPTEVPPDDQFRYGWREVPYQLADGTTEWERIPLTLADVLHPKEGEVIPENTLHNTERDYLAKVCRLRIRGRQGALVLSDCLIDWEREDIRDLSPDVAVLFNVADPSRKRGKF